MDATSDESEEVNFRPPSDHRAVSDSDDDETWLKCIRGAPAIVAAVILWGGVSSIQSPVSMVWSVDNIPARSVPALLFQPVLFELNAPRCDRSDATPPH